MRVHTHIFVMKYFLPLCIFLLLAVPGILSAQEKPVIDVLTDGGEVHIILRSTPPQTSGFNAYRRGPDDRNYLPLTSSTVRPVADPYQAYDLFRRDAAWLARKFDTTDPVRLWRKIGINRNYAQAYSLISPGLRMALGRTLIDRSVEPGEMYRYRIVLLDRRGDEIDTINSRIRVEQPDPVEPPDSVTAVSDRDQFDIRWEYDEYRGRSGDNTVGFHIYRREAGGQPRRINEAPVLRVEDYLNYFDSGARERVTYQYGVQAVDIIGRVSNIVYSEPVRITDTTPPLVPMGLTAVDRDDGVLLIWNISPEGDVRSYNVYRSTSVEGEYSRINSDPVPFDDPRFTDTDLIRGKAWFYQVTAMDATGNESPPCGAVTIIPQDTEAPGAVEGLSHTVDPDDMLVRLQWDPNPEPDIKGYFVYRAEGEKSMMRITSMPIEAADAPRFEDSGFREKGLLPGREYRYAVSAVDTSNNESERTEVRLEMPDNEAPREVFSFSARSTRDGEVELRWQPSLSRDLELHRIYRQMEKGAAQIIAELPADQTDYLDDGVERGRSYSYYVVEVDAAENASGPSRTREVIPIDSTDPGPPRNLQAVKEGSRIRVTWESPDETDLVGYRVYRADYPGAKLRQISEEPVTETEYSLRFTSEAAEYTVRALDSSGNEGPGESVQLKEGR
ncbi:MAG: hypothetical protein ACP5IA_12320 [Sediminispirochaetaceae bacterium]